MNRRALLAVAAAATALVLVLVAFGLPRLSASPTVPAPTITAAPPQASPVTNSQPQSPPTTSTRPQTETAAYAVSADQAGSIALTGAAGATLAGTPSLVTYQGVVAYEVPLSTGMAYVDATSGQVLAAPGTAGTTSGSGTTTRGEGEGSSESEEEHEGGD